MGLLVYGRAMRWIATALAVGALAACGSNTELAKDASEQGNPCNAATIEPHSSKYAGECAAQKRREGVESEAHEAESVIKHRHAEELANTAEGR